MVPKLGALSPPTDHICPVALRELGTMTLDEPQDKVIPNVYCSTMVPVCLCSWQNINVWRKRLTCFLR